jgi:hypothetical protein
MTDTTSQNLLQIRTGTAADVQACSQICTVRPATNADLAECNRRCQQVHGFDRSQECDRAIQRGTATIVERDGRITGYATTIGLFGHAVGERNGDLQALIAAVTLQGSGFLLATSYSSLS